jgi:hypothetical protein
MALTVTYARSAVRQLALRVGRWTHAQLRGQLLLVKTRALTVQHLQPQGGVHALGQSASRGVRPGSP